MRNNRCFLDMSGLIALNNAGDQHHKESREIAATLKESDMIISDAVVTETYNLLRYRSGFHIARFFLETVLANGQIILADVTPSIRKSTLQILEQYSDHKISYSNTLKWVVTTVPDELVHN